MEIDEEQEMKLSKIGACQIQAFSGRIRYHILNSELKLVLNLIFKD